MWLKFFPDIDKWDFALYCSLSVSLGKGIGNLGNISVVPGVNEDIY